MKLFITLFLASLLVFTSCGYKAAEETAAGTQPPTAPAAGQSVTSSDSPVQQVSDVNPITPVQTATTSTGLPATATTSTAGLNPAHGQPGHRCEIAVGAPLDSKPTANATPPAPTTTTVSPVTATSQQAAPATAAKSTAGLNPAHGQPGHRCDLAVGAPLDGKPVSTPVPGSTPVANSTPVNANTPSKSAINPIPVTPLMPAGTASGTASGLNPAHGQPGHRCDLAVGAPLNGSKPVTPATKQ